MLMAWDNVFKRMELSPHTSDEVLLLGNLSGVLRSKNMPEWRNVQIQIMDGSSVCCSTTGLAQVVGRDDCLISITPREVSSGLEEPTVSWLRQNAEKSRLRLRAGRWLRSKVWG